MNSSKQFVVDLQLMNHHPPLLKPIRTGTIHLTLVMGQHLNGNLQEEAEAEVATTRITILIKIPMDAAMAHFADIDRKTTG